MSDEGITGGDVYAIDAAGGDPVDLTPGLAASVQTITWNGSDRQIIATEFAAGEEMLAAIDARSGTQRELWRAAEMIWANNLFDFAPGDSGISLSRNGRFSAVIRQSYTAPPEIETGAPGQWRRITHLNDDAQVLTGKATNISWKSDGLSIQGLLVEPPTVVPGARGIVGLAELLRHEQYRHVDASLLRRFSLRRSRSLRAQLAHDLHQ
jgi:dipeptidyl aminopeptidase/acylaminoacyl peptidase